jgi:hypothetical protein
LLLDVPGDGAGFADGPFGPILDTTLLAPGSSVSADVDALNSDGPPGRLSLRALDIADLESACSPAESSVDTTCGSGPGELRDVLRFDILADSDGDGAADDFEPVVVDATIDELAGGLPLVDRDMEPGDIWTFRLTARLPVTSGNETMTDRLDFQFRWTLSEADGAGSSDVVTGGDPGTDPPALESGGTGSPGQAPTPAAPNDVLGEQLDRSEPAAPAVGADPDPAGPVGGWLPRTGGPGLTLELSLALALVLAGLANRLAGRRRRAP